MTTGASDADLVQAHLAGDRAALAAIYDRYAPSMYDTAAALLGDRDEAADVVQDTFLAASQHLDHLRDPTRLRAWLFAITRHEVERRGRKRRRAVPTAAVADMAPPTVPDLGAEVDHAELAALVRAAASGLDERDQLVLELSIRQGLDGGDLAAALGVTPAQSYSLVFRMRERVSRALGALVVARTGRRDCPELADLLRDWDGTFSVLVRKRVARHVERCEVCERTKARAALPALLGAAPAFALPVGLRERVLSRAEAGLGSAAGDLSFGRDGFPRAAQEGSGGPRRRRAVMVGAAAVAVAVLAGGTALLARRGGDTTVEVTRAGTSPVVAEPTAAPTTTSTVASTSTPDEVTSAAAPTTAPTIPPLPPTPLPTVAPTPPPTVAPSVPRLSLSTTSVSLGDTDSTAVVDVLNTGGGSLPWSATAVSGAFRAAGGGTVPAGGRAPLTITLDRTGLPEGNLVGVVRVTSSSGQADVQVSGAVERSPVIGTVAFADRAVRVDGCAPRATTVSVTVSDESPSTVVATVTAPDGRAAAIAMARSGATWSGTVGPFAVAGRASVGVTATDARGNQATASRPLGVLACSG